MVGADGEVATPPASFAIGPVGPIEEWESILGGEWMGRCWRVWRRWCVSMTCCIRFRHCNQDDRSGSPMRLPSSQTSAFSPYIPLSAGSGSAQHLSSFYLSSPRKAAWAQSYQMLLFYAYVLQTMDFPDRTVFPEHEALWDGANSMARSAGGASGIGTVGMYDPYNCPTLEEFHHRLLALHHLQSHLGFKSRTVAFCVLQTRPAFAESPTVRASLVGHELVAESGGSSSRFAFF